jgi:hypothetical protein
MVQMLELSDLFVKATVSYLILAFIAALTDVSSILISVTINGVKSRKVVCTVVKFDRRIFSDSSTTYRETFIFTLAQAIAVYTYVAVLFAYEAWVWKHVAEKMSTWSFFSWYAKNIVNLETVVQFCNLGLLLRSRLQSLNKRLRSILKEFDEPHSEITLLTNVPHNYVSSYTEKINSVSVSRSVALMTHVESPQLLNLLRKPHLKTSKESNIYHTRELYDDLCDISSLINSKYGYQILLGPGVSTMELTTSLHFILATPLVIKNLGVDTIGHFISLMTAWLLLISFKLISITAPCQSATTEAENTGVLVKKLLLVRHFDQDTVTEQRLFPSSCSSAG